MPASPEPANPSMMYVVPQAYQQVYQPMPMMLIPAYQPMPANAPLGPYGWMDAGVPSNDVATSWSGPTLQPQPTQRSGTSDSWLGNKQVQPDGSLGVIDVNEQLQWQFCRDVAKHLEEQEGASWSKQEKGEARSKSTVRRRRRRQAQMQTAEMQHQQMASKLNDPSADEAGSDVSDALENRPELFEGKPKTSAEDRRLEELAEKLIARLRLGGDHASDAIASMQTLAFESQLSCRVAQKAIGLAYTGEATALAYSMRGHVRKAVQSPFANYVMQRIIECIPTQRISPLIEELHGFGGITARHRYGVRILSRIVEYVPLDEGPAAQLIEEVLDSGVEELCKNEFGSFLMRLLLEFGLPEHRRRIVSALSQNIFGYAKHGSGSFVLETAFFFCAVEEQRMLAQKLLAKRGPLLSLCKDEFGSHVLSTLLKSPELGKEAWNDVSPLMPQLRSCRYWKRIQSALNVADERVI